MNKTLKKLALLTVPAVTAAVLASAAPVAALNPLEASCDTNAAKNSYEICNSSGSLFGNGGIWENIINTLIFIIGAAAVIMIIVGGIKYVTAAGDESNIKTAKNTILYAVVGLVLAVAAGGIVNFVLGRL